MNWVVRGHISGDSRVEIVDGVLIPETLRITATHEKIPLEVEMHADVVEGRMVARHLSCEAIRGETLTTELLRQVPVANILRAGVVSGIGILPLAGKNLPVLKAAGPTDETLKVVAILYRLAYLIGHPPTARVREVFDLPKSTASRWVQLARESGYLGTTPPRTAGVGDEPRPSKHASSGAARRRVAGGPKKRSAR